MSGESRKGGPVCQAGVSAGRVIFKPLRLPCLLHGEIDATGQFGHPDRVQPVVLGHEAPEVVGLPGTSGPRCQCRGSMPLIRSATTRAARGTASAWTRGGAIGAPAEPPDVDDGVAQVGDFERAVGRGSGEWEFRAGQGGEAVKRESRGSVSHGNGSPPSSDPRMLMQLDRVPPRVRHERLVPVRPAGNRITYVDALRA